MRAGCHHPGEVKCVTMTVKRVTLFHHVALQCCRKPERKYKKGGSKLETEMRHSGGVYGCRNITGVKRGLIDRRIVDRVNVEYVECVVKDCFRTSTVGGLIRTIGPCALRSVGAVPL